MSCHDLAWCLFVCLLACLTVFLCVAWVKRNFCIVALFERVSEMRMTDVILASGKCTVFFETTES